MGDDQNMCATLIEKGNRVWSTENIAGSENVGKMELNDVIIQMTASFKDADAVVFKPYESTKKSTKQTCDKQLKEWTKLFKKNAVTTITISFVRTERHVAVAQPKKEEDSNRRRLSPLERLVQE